MSQNYLNHYDNGGNKTIIIVKRFITHSQRNSNVINVNASKGIGL